jgi:hypothetical protein
MASSFYGVYDDFLLFSRILFEKKWPCNNWAIIIIKKYCLKVHLKAYALIAGYILPLGVYFPSVAGQ